MEEHAQKETVSVRREKIKEALLGQLGRMPILQVACERAGVSRATMYRMRDEDPEFKKAIDEAIAEGVSFINDMSEGQMMAMIKERNWPAISFWLRARHPAYRAKVEVDARIKETKSVLTPEQESLIQRALQLVARHEDTDQDQTNEKAK